METGIEALLYRHELHCQKVSSIRWANLAPRFLCSLTSPGRRRYNGGAISAGLDGSVREKRHCLGDGHPRNVEVVRGKGRVGIADG
jgi:hypothetical protein